MPACPSWADPRTVLRPFHEVVATTTDADAGTLVPLAQALATLVDDDVRPVTGAESLALDHALDRVLAADLDAPIALPPFDRATRTGFAVNPGERPDAARFRLLATAADGRAAAASLPPGTAVPIATGAPVPAGAAFVLAREQARVEAGEVLVAGPPPREPHLRRRGADLAAGARVLAAGRRLSARDLALCGALGLDRVPVRRRVRVALLSIGDEVTSPGRPLPDAGVFDASGVLLRALLTTPPIEVVAHRTVADDGELVEARLREAVADADCVIASGSLGAAGPARALLDRLGGRLLLDRTAMKPGKPAVFGRVGEVPVCGLPGNPVAAFVTFALIVRPLLARRAGTEPRQPLAMLAEAGFAHRGEAGRTELLPVTLALGPDRPRLQRPATVGAAKLTALADADGLAVLTPDRDELAPGDPVGFVPFGEVAGL